MISHFSVITTIFITDLSLLNNNNIRFYVNDMVVIVDSNSNKCIMCYVYVQLESYLLYAVIFTEGALKSLQWYLRCIFYIIICCTKYTVQIFLPVAPLYCIQKGYLACLASPKAAFKFASSGLRSKSFLSTLCAVFIFYLFILDCDLLVSFSCFLVISLQTLLTPQYCKLVAIIFVRDQRYKCQYSATAYVPVVCCQTLTTLLSCQWTMVSLQMKCCFYFLKCSCEPL